MITIVDKLSKLTFLKQCQTMQPAGRKGSLRVSGYLFTHLWAEKKIFVVFISQRSSILHFYTSLP